MNTLAGLALRRFKTAVSDEILESLCFPRSSLISISQTLGSLKLYSRPNRPRDPHFKLVAGNLQIVMGLQVEPPFGPCPEIPRKPQCCVRADGPPAPDNLANPQCRHSNALARAYCVSPSGSMKSPRRISPA